MNASNQNQSSCRSCCGTQSDLSSDAWQARYESGNTGWDRGMPSPMLGRWLEAGVLKPCRILVPGCGRGHEVVALADAGFEVTAVDFADEAVSALTKALNQRFLNATVIQSDLFAFEPTKPFDAVYEQTTLCAIDPSQWQTYEQLLACWLRPGGKLMAMFMQSDKPDGPPFHCELNSMKQLFQPTNWEWCGDAQRVEHPMGMHELACVLQRNETES